MFSLLAKSWQFTVAAPTHPSSLSHLSSALWHCQQVRTRYQYLRSRTRIKRDILRRQSVQEHEVLRLCLKSMHRDQRLPMRTRLQAMMTMYQMHPYTRLICLKERCVLTGRGHGLVPGGWRLSRIMFREQAINGRLPGVVEARW